MRASWISILVTVSLVTVASVIIIGVPNIPLWALALTFVAWIACFGADALYTLRFGRAIILERELNVIFRTLYRKIGRWAAVVHLGLELAGITALSLVIERISAGALGGDALAAGVTLVLAGEHLVAFFENRAFAQTRRNGHSSS